MALTSVLLSAILVAIVGALIFSQQFRKDLLAASGEASFGGLNVRGAIIGVLMLLLIAGIVYIEKNSIEKSSLVLKKEDDGEFSVAPRRSPNNIIYTFSAAELESAGLFDRDRILGIPEFLADANWVPVNKETGRTIELDIEQLNYKKARPPKDIFSKIKLRLIPGKDDRYQVVLLSDNEYILGNLDYSTIKSEGFFRKVESITFPAEESPIITAKFDSTWQDDDNIYPFLVHPTLASYSIKIQSKEGDLIDRRSANMGKLIIFAAGGAYYSLTIGKVHIEEPYPPAIGAPYVQFRIARLDFDLE